MKKNTITNILVKPKREGKFIYYINENLDNGHYANRDEMYQVISEVVPVSVAQEALQLLRSYSTFFLDVESQKCYEFELDYESAMAEIKSNILHPSASTAKKSENELDTSSSKWYLNIGGILSNLKDRVNKQ